MNINYPTKNLPSFILTDTQNLTRHQIYKLQHFKRPKLLHAQSSEDQTDLQQTETDLLNPPPILTTTPVQIPQPNPTPFIDSIINVDPSKSKNDPHEQPQTNKWKHLNQQQYTNEDIHEPKRQRLPHDPETQTTSELPTTHPFIPINTMATEDVYIPSDPLLETPTIPIFFHMQPQPQTINPTLNETTLDSPNQEHVVTETYEFKPHSVPTMETPAQSPPTPSEPSRQQLPPEIWTKMTNIQRKNWRNRHNK